ncbi:MAG: CRISPR-associated helicase Cas3' [Burkholderiales bacterium]|nr:CRISPR-associated helicase Cas3' [Burkholderiales bacterium]
MRFGDLPQSARSIWAKSGEGGGHGLLAHLLDVAAVAEAILAREPAAIRRLVADAWGVAGDAAGRWVAALVGLHDFGKAIPGFQMKWADGAAEVERAGMPFHPSSLSCSQHSLATAALLAPALQRLTGAAALWCHQVVQAVAAHHGYHFLPAELEGGVPRREGAAWAAARQAIVDAYWAVLSPPGCPTAPAMTLPWVNWLAGLTSVADWVASNPAWFPLGEREEGLLGHFARARTLAERALDAVRWHPYRPLLAGHGDLDHLLARIVARPGIQARPLQRGAHALLSEVNGPALVLVEAPMGEGKTELAFLAHLQLQATNQHRGLYVALPTQATGNALFTRATTFLEGFADGPLDIQLVHGGAAMNEQLIALRGIDQSEDEALGASAWFGQKRRPLLSPYGVGTVDQMLYAALNVKHHFVRMWGLSNRVVVLDEVHAYDTYTTGLIVTLLRWLKALGCSVVLMSATLPRARRHELLRAWGGGAEQEETPYPRLAVVDARGTRAVHVGARPLPEVQLVGMGSGVAEMAAAAQAAVREGGCVAVIVNTVSRAQAVYLALRSCLPASDEVTLVLFHARFPADERAERERDVLGLFGPGGERPTRAILVATQVVEQSLDIDFDVMFSDLAPVDLLLQRAGRLHRHGERTRPVAHAQPRLVVAGLQAGALSAWKETGWAFVYDAYILGRTWALLLQETALRLPQDIDRLVQAVYDIDHGLPEALEQAARQFIEGESYGAYLARVGSERMQSFHIAVDPDAEPAAAYDGKPRGHEEDELGLGLTNRTRLGQESITVVPVIVGDDGRWHARHGDAGFFPDAEVGPEMARALYARQVKLSRTGVVKRLKAGPLANAFESHPLLRQMFPLPCVGQRAADAGLRVVVDPELGLVFGDAVSDVGATEGEA